MLRTATRPTPVRAAFIVYTSTYTFPGDEKLCRELCANRPEAIAALSHQLSRDQTPRDPMARVPHDEARLMQESGERLAITLAEKNAELSRTRADLRSSEERLQAIIDTEPECVKVISPEGLVVDMNPAGLAMFEADSIEQVRGRAILDLVAPEHRAALQQLHDRVFAGGSGALAFETLGLRGTRRWLQTHNMALREDGRITALLGIARDVSDVRAAQSALRTIEERYRRLFESGVIGVMISTFDGRIIESNDCVAEMLGYAGDEFRRDVRRWDTLSPPEWRAASQRAVRALRETGVCAPFDKEYFHKNGSRVPVQIRLAALDSRTGENLCLVTDISERKRVEAELQHLTGRLLHAQDEERRRLARELHDSTAQMLAALGMNLVVLANTASTLEQGQRELLAECESQVQRATAQLRTFSYLLHPPALDGSGLVQAVPDFSHGFAKRSGLEVRLDLPSAMDRLPEAIELSLFRVLQECLGNAYRHAGGTRISIRLTRQRNVATLEVRDDGRGFPTHGNGEQRPQSVGVGILGMRERLRLLGGRLEIESTSSGTCVRAIVPLPAGAP